jgi:hypothetical protein
VCEATENSNFCKDCQQVGPVCGDGVCDAGEGSWNCPADCPSFCGDGVCRPDEVDTCQGDCPPSVTCGDGQCSAFENNQNCPGDCQNVTPTHPPTATIPPAAATATPGVTASPTDAPTPTAEPTEEEEEETAEPDTAPADEPAASPPAPEAEEVTACEIVPGADLSTDVVDDTLASLSGGASNRQGGPVLWVACAEGAGEVCLPPEAIALSSAGSQPVLLDCDGRNECRSYPLREQADGLWCASAGADEDPISCEAGCAVVDQTMLRRGVPLQTAALVGIPLAVLVGGGLAAFVILSRRSREEPAGEGEDDTG